MFAKYFNPNIVSHKQAFKRKDDYNIIIFLSDKQNLLNFANHFTLTNYCRLPVGTTRGEVLSFLPTRFYNLSCLPRRGWLKN